MLNTRRVGIWGWTQRLAAVTIVWRAIPPEVRKATTKTCKQLVSKTAIAINTALTTR